MQSVLKYMKNFTLGFLVLLLFSNSTFAYSVDFHFCQDEIQSVSFFGNKATCSKMVESYRGSCCDKNTRTSDRESISSKSCCSNEQVENSSVLQKKADATPTFFSSIYALLPNEVSVASIVFVDLSRDEFKIAHPPFLYRQNKRAKLQVFLI